MPLEEFLGVFTEHLAPYDIQGMQVAKHVTAEWPVNWKTAADVFYEAYHVHAVHPQITGAMDDYNIQVDVYENGMSRFLVAFGRISPRWEDQETLNNDMRQFISVAGKDPEDFVGRVDDVRGELQAAIRAQFEKLGIDVSKFVDAHFTDSWTYGIFPNMQISTNPEGSLVQRWRPHESDPERCYFDVYTLVHPKVGAQSPRGDYLDWSGDGDFDSGERPERQILVTKKEQEDGLGLVGYQDYLNILPVQAGLKSRGFKGMHLCEQELRLRHYHKEIDRYMNGEK